MSKIDVLYVLPNTPEPRNENIIRLIKDEYKTGVMYWKKNPKAETYNIDNCGIFAIPISADAHNPLKRIIPMIRYMRSGIKKIQELEPRVIHVSKVDSMIMVNRYAKRAKVKPKIIYDISIYN